MRLLEQELGVELLHRTTHEFELTEAGQFLFHRGPVLLGAADRLWREVRSFGTGERGTLVFAYGASADYETARRLLRALMELHPEIAVTTQVDSVADIVSGVDDGSLDIGLVRCPPEVSSLGIRPIRLESQGLLLHADHRLASGDVVAWTEQSAETLLLHPRDANPGHYDAVLAPCREHGAEPEVLLRRLQRVLSLAGVLEVHYGGGIWASVDHRAADLQDLFFNEPWFFVEGLAFGALGWIVSRTGRPRRQWVAAAVAATAGLTALGLLSATGVVGRAVVG